MMPPGTGARAANLMAKVFLDTEFLDDGRLIQLLSIGLASETGAEYYAVAADGGMDSAAGNAWLRANVLPHLPVVLTGSGWEWDTAHPEYPRVRPRAQIARDIRAFMAGQPDPELWAFFSPYDAVVLCQLYGPMSAVPDEVPAFVKDLMQEAERSGAALPRQEPPAHHALHDARYDRLVAQSIGLIK